jgi:hypothetical protein
MLKMSATDVKSEKSTDVTGKDKGFYDPMAVTWMDKYSSTLDKIWANLPMNMRPVIVTLAVFTFGATIRGKFFFLKLVVCILLRVLGQVQGFRLTQHWFQYFIQ